MGSASPLHCKDRIGVTCAICQGRAPLLFKKARLLRAEPRGAAKKCLSLAFQGSQSLLQEPEARLLALCSALPSLLSSVALLCL